MDSVKSNRSASSVKDAKAPQKSQSARPFRLDPMVAFYCFLLPNVLGALYAPIQDCDEVFNYWEPTHYLTHGFGLQTWEWSPEYAIRSWFYVSLHAMASKIGSLVPFTTKVHEFYFLRIALAFACAACETRLFLAISRTFNPRIGIMFLLCMVFSPGMFHASVAYLPSSFAMYGVMLGMAAFLDWRGGLKTGLGIMWFGIAGIVGWPFTMALAIPFLLEDIALAVLTKAGIESAIWRFLDGIVRSLIVLGLGVCFDLFFYHKPEVVPFNMVWYNVFSGAGRGPNIFGTEPWHFYIRNLILNFNIWFILATLAMPLIALQMYVGDRALSSQSRLRSIVFLSPFYLWLAIFTVQPHKEERFMYPCYPALALNAAMSLHIILSSFGSTNPGTLFGKIPAKLKFAVVSVVMLASIEAGLFRTLGIVTAYSAPLHIHKALQSPEYATSSGNVCYGKEWYRYPSSYFLPAGMRAKFVKSAFDGLLPGEFSEASIGFGIWPTWLIPSGMNDQNVEDFGKYVGPSFTTEHRSDLTPA
ncbi:MAG: mannosyltransferase [Sclerophora amabilis]|nr:MAG: mannosyltransferase [Sclerophora amabilis]